MSPVVTLDNPPVQSRSLHVPNIEEVAKVLRDGLPSNFMEVQVEVTDCPDLTQQPFTLARSGLGGNPQLIEVGGPPYLIPLINREKVYDIKDIARITGLNDSVFIIGAGAGPWPYAGVNCELIANIDITKGNINSQTRIAKVDTKNNNSCHTEILPASETRYAVLANLMASQGLPGKVIKVYCKKRTGPDDFIASIRKSLQNHYKEKAVGLGGTFLLKEGTVKQHVMPDFSTTPILSDEDVSNWLKFFEMPSPLINVGTLVSADVEDLDLRLQHFHSFSYHGYGGHYHIDLTPDIVEYLGYFVIAEKIHRVDKPATSHKIGRD